MADDLSDETKCFRTAIETEDTVQAEIKAEQPEIEEISDEPTKTTTTPLPFAASSTGSLMPPGMAASGLPAFASPLFSPFYPSYPNPNAMAAMTAMVMSPQYQAVAQNMAVQTMFMSAMANMKLNSPQVTPSYPAAEFGSSKPESSEVRRTPKRPMKGEVDKDRIKKPLNSFMIYKQEMRKKLMEDPEFQNKHSADINAILGQRWHMLSEEEQKVYYDKAAAEKLEHEKKYPGWSARDNYTVRNRRGGNRKQLFSSPQPGSSDQSDHKRCRALFGIENQAKWCRHCKVKKRCLLIPTDGEDLPDVAASNPAAEIQMMDKTPQPSPTVPQMNRMMPQYGMPFGMPQFGGFPGIMGMSPLAGYMPQAPINPPKYESPNPPDPK
uniref:dTCF n=1 Tax=Panagrellus redivivus TaxID=6233 RepID=A0A7E4V5Q2_PANRE